uniref:DSD1 family PLP-dependent enzyme n=1 Tax=uncultured Sphingomonas sp. TaxID=158754 RepID=UPI0035CA7083
MTDSTLGAEFVLLLTTDQMMDEIRLHGHLIDHPLSRSQLNTPALIVKRDALERNIGSMAAFCRDKQVQLRPHAKTHKCVEIAQRQLEAGAIGICCAKLGEAEALAEGGLASSILLTSPIVSAPAIARLVALQSYAADLMCVVDHPSNVQTLDRAFSKAGRTLQVLIDIDPGFQRTGVASAEAAVGLLRAIEAAPALRLVGVQFYCGQHQHIRSFEDRRVSVTERVAFAKDIVAALRGAGAPIGVITGGGTGTHRIDAELAFFTELQAGSYIFMDNEYLECDLVGDGSGSPFQISLFVDATVISANTPGRVTIDAGIKALATDAGIPAVAAGAPCEACYQFMGDEHGALVLEGDTLPALGERVTLVTSHCDPTVNLHAAFHVVSGDTLVALWPISARGRSR